MGSILIVGATSAIAEATARRFAQEGHALFLVGRREARLAALSDDLRVRGATSVAHFVMDINALDRHADMLRSAEAAIGALDIAFIAHGTLPDQAACQNDAKLTVVELRTNALGTIALLTRIAAQFEQRGRGTIAVITSVAADRGRESNYVYGAAKAAVETFCEGLRQRLHKSGVRVVTIKPGFIDTPMTAGFKKGLLWTRPEAAAARIHRAIARGWDVVYVPAWWRIIMLVIRLLPRRLYKRIKL